MQPIGVMTDREKQVFDLRTAGKTFKEIGDTIGVSRSQAKVIHHHAWQKKTISDEGTAHNGHLFLSTRSHNCLSLNGIEVSDKDAHIKAARLSARELLAFENFGKRSLAEVQDWLLANGLSLRDEPQHEKTATLCPHCGKVI